MTYLDFVIVSLEFYDQPDPETETDHETACGDA